MQPVGERQHGVWKERRRLCVHCGGRALRVIRGVDIDMLGMGSG